MPIESMEKAETFAQIRATLEELPVGDRDILTMRYALEYDATQIADVLGINATAVHMRLTRARQRLAERLTAQGTTALP
jgi:RNA polymerase sigma-70 factor (ECF subfamily)